MLRSLFNTTFMKHDYIFKFLFSIFELWIVIKKCSKIQNFVLLFISTIFPIYLEMHSIKIFISVHFYLIQYMHA